MEPQTFRLEYVNGKLVDKAGKVLKPGVPEALIFAVPDHFDVAHVRARINFARDAYTATELWKRYQEAAEGETVSRAGLPAGDYEAWETWMSAGLPDAIAAVVSLEVDGVMDARPVDELRAALRNDVKRHDALRNARTVLFFNGGAPRDAE